VTVSTTCPACGAGDGVPFHEQRRIPTNSCLLLESMDEASSYPRGDLLLHHCRTCGFVWNGLFDAALSEYSERYEETQVFSPRFVEFGRSLAERWVNEHGLVGRRVLEIGCGKGEFLQWMVEAGAGEGIGIDPGTHPERIESPVADRLTWLVEKYGEHHASIEADAIVCRHTLEHIAPVAEFMTTIRRSIGDRLDTVVLFELPDLQRVLDETAFWDVYYEHCSYFTCGSLTRLFERTGFEVLDVELDYDDQYILLVARPVAGEPTPFVSPLVDDLDRIERGVEHFKRAYDETITKWSAQLEEVRGRGGRSVVWGAGSKGVAFLTSLPSSESLVACAVDVNPYKTGKYMAGSGHVIVDAAALRDISPDLVVVMNPIYTEEISSMLRGLGLEPELDAV
jgi:SAM-dependent methyltransferase